MKADQQLVRTVDVHDRVGNVVGSKVVVLYAGSSGALDDVPLNRVHDFEQQYLAFLRSSHADVLASLRDEKKWTDALQKKCDELCKQFKAQFLA